MLKQFLKFSYGNWVSAAISFFTTPIITLLIVPAEFGKSSMFTLALSFISQIGLSGLDQSFMRFFYEKEEKDRPGLAWLCMGCSLGITAAVSCCILPFWRRISGVLFEEENFTTVLLLLFCLAASIVDRFATSVVRMNQKGTVFSLIRIVNAVVNAAAIICYARFVAPVFHAIVVGTIVSSIISIAISVFAERKFWLRHISVIFNSGEIKAVFHFGLPVIPAFIIGVLFQGMDKMALRAWSSFDEIGLYAAANKFVVLLTIIQTGFTMYWYPTALEAYEKDHENFYFFETMFKYMALAVLIAASVLLLLKDVIVLLLAPSYRDSMYIMPFLTLVPLMYILGDISGLGTGFKKQTWWNIIVMLAAALVNFAGNYFLVPLFGAKGAALATGAAYICYFSFRTYISVRLFPARYPVCKFLPSFAVLLVFLALNTFFAIPWWLNMAPLVFVCAVNWNTMLELWRAGLVELRRKQ
jgi:O-antigen/teichoic acid export membrane protein